MRMISMVKRKRGTDEKLMRYDPLLFSLTLGTSRTYNAHTRSNCRWFGTTRKKSKINEMGQEARRRRMRP